MPITIAVIAPGEMGSAVGARLVAGGARVITLLTGRSVVTAERASRAGFAVADDEDDLLRDADLVLSIVPPGEAVTLAQALRPFLARAPRRPVYVDFNALAPDTARHIGAMLAGTGCPYVDGGIIGPPPAAGVRTAFYVSGEASAAVAKLRDFGLDVRVLDGPVGAASALKMSYGGITKGVTGIGTAMMLGAAAAGCDAALVAELQESQPQLARWLSRQVPVMFPKAYRFVAEMEEVADFLHRDRPACEIYRAIALLYGRLAGPEAEAEREALARICTELAKAAAAPAPAP